MSGGHEKWQTLDEFHNYEVSSYGRVRLTLSRKIVQQTRDENGYYTVRLLKNDIIWVRKVHRLVADTFIPSRSYTSILHFDNDKANNHASNLRRYTDFVPKTVRKNPARTSQYLPKEPPMKGKKMTEEQKQRRLEKIEYNRAHPDQPVMVRRIKRMDTGKVYQNMKLAAADMQAKSISGLSKALAFYDGVYKGVKFEWVEVEK